MRRVKPKDRSISTDGTTLNFLYKCSLCKQKIPHYSRISHFSNFHWMEAHKYFTPIKNET